MHEELLAKTGIYVATFIIALVSGLVPVVNAEAYLLLVSAILPPGAVLPVVLLAASGQMIAKLALYLTGKGALRLPLRRWDEKIEAWRTRIETRKGRADVLIFVSAFVGLPPFYVLSIVAGILRFRLAEFVVWGFVGRSLRFGVVVLFPQFVKGLTS